jgi:hypothetical protein
MRHVKATTDPSVVQESQFKGMYRAAPTAKPHRDRSPQCAINKGTDHCRLANDPNCVWADKTAKAQTSVAALAGEALLT